MAFVLPAAPSFGQSLVDKLTEAGGNIGKGLEKKHAYSVLENYKKRKSGDISPNQEDNAAEKKSVGSIGDITSAYEATRTILGDKGADAWLKGELQEQKLEGQLNNAVKLKNLERQSTLAQKQAEASIGKREAIEKQRVNYRIAQQSIDSGDVGGFDKNYLARLLGPAGDPLLTASGATLQSTAKQILLEDINLIAGRPNQFIEQQISTATPGIGKSKEANASLILAGNAKLDLDEQLLDISDELRENYESKGIPTPANFDKIVHEIAKPQAQFIQDKLAYDLRVQFEKEKGEKYLNNLEKVSSGTPLTIEKRDALLKKFNGDKEKTKKVAEKLGYTIPSSNIIMKEQNQG